MAKKIGKEPLWEQQKKLLLDSVSLKMPLLHQSLVAAYGEGDGRRIYAELYEAGYKKRLQHFKDKDIVDVISAEIDVFPALGWKIWMDVCEENGEKVCYEHLEYCPHLEATRACKLPDPCAILCDLDCRLSAKYRLGVWERISHIPSGGSECCFKIKPWPRGQGD